MLAKGTWIESVEVRPLSSTQTLIAKWLFPALWISGFGIGTVLMWLHCAITVINAPRLQFLIVWLFGTMLLILGPSRLKRVHVDATNIYVSNYFREAAVPLANICGVTQNRLLNWHPIRVHFREPTAFGTSIVFMPRFRWSSLWGSDPVVAELMKLSHLSEVQLPGSDT
jgi:hypothetical protein